MDSCLFYILRHLLAVGTWETYSNFTSFAYPLGTDLFGGKNVIERTQSDLNKVLKYNTKFKRLGTDNVIIPDRIYNVESILTASIGSNTIQDDRQYSNNNIANRLHLTVQRTH